MKSNSQLLQALSVTGRMLSLSAYNTVDNPILDESNVISVSFDRDAGLLKSLMGRYEILVTGSLPNLQVGNTISHLVLGASQDMGQTFATIDFGAHTVAEIEYSIEDDTTKLVLYDNMLKSMKAFKLNLTYSMTNYQFLQNVCNAINLTIDQSINTNDYPVLALTRNTETYTDSDTYRDVLDDFAEILGGCLIVKDSVLSLVKPTEVNYTIDETQLITITKKEEFKQISSIVLSRQPQEDNVYYPSSSSSGQEVKIINNGLVEGNVVNSVNDRTPYLQPIYNAIRQWGSFTTCELESYGYLVFDPCDIITVQLQGQASFKIMWMGSSFEFGFGGLKENMESSVPEAGTTDYTKATTESRQERATYIYVDKVAGEIGLRVSDIESATGNVPLSTVTTYAYGDSASTHPADEAFTYTTFPPAVSDKFIWRKTVVTRADDTVDTEYTLVPAGVTSIVSQYRLSTSDEAVEFRMLTPGEDADVGSGIAPLTQEFVTQLANTDWSETMPEVLPGTFLWGRDKYTYFDGTIGYSEPVYLEAIQKNAMKANLVEQRESEHYAELILKADSIETNVYGSISTASEDLQKKINAINNGLDNKIKGIVTTTLQEDEKIGRAVSYVQENGDKLLIATDYLDDEGFHVETAGTNNRTNINGDGLTVTDKTTTETVLVANATEGVIARDVTVKNYLNIVYNSGQQNSFGFRFEPYSDTNDSYQLGVYGW